jgi:hypothetical protein
LKLFCHTLEFACMPSPWAQERLRLVNEKPPQQWGGGCDKFIEQVGD